jgi:hypothetical protein
MSPLLDVVGSMNAWFSIECTSNADLTFLSLVNDRG